MTEARLESVPPDAREARVFTSAAKIFLGDAEIGGTSDPGRQVLLHNGAIAACDAVLLAAGLRVTSGDGAHVLRLDTAVELLGADDDLTDRLHEARVTRNEASYSAAFPSAGDVAAALAATEELVELAESFVSDAE